MDAVAVPVTAAERIGALDALRGVAVPGIMVMNIYGSAMPFAAYLKPLARAAAAAGFGRMRRYAGRKRNDNDG